MNQAPDPIRAGDVVEVAEQHYCYGLGTLILQVTEVGRIEQHSDGRWLNLHGIQLRPDGVPLNSRPRHALVRLSAVRKRQPGRAT